MSNVYVDIATTQPTTQNKTKEFGWCGIIIGKRTHIASTAKRIASAASDVITFKATKTIKWKNNNIFFKWKTNSICFEKGKQPHFFLNGRQPQTT